MHINLFNQVQHSLQKNLCKKFEEWYSIFFPYHCVHYCAHYNQAKTIYQHLSASNPNLIIVDEEDTYLKLNFVKFCEDLRDTNKVVTMITNSQQACIIAKQVNLPAIHALSLVDAICYFNIQDTAIDFDIIQFHSGVIYSNMDHSFREEALDYIKIYKDKLSLYSDGTELYNPKKLSENQFLVFGRHPQVDIQKDACYTNYMAFGIALENYDHDTFGPTVSEKILKYMHLKRPVLAYGAPGIRDYLLRFGFDTWDWLVDWNFDKEMDLGRRQKKFKQEISRLMDMPLDKLKNIIYANKHKLDYNFHHVQTLINQYPDCIMKIK